jgi:hypothetical protein
LGATDDRSVFFIGMLIFLFFGMISLVMLLNFSKMPFKATMWQLKWTSVEKMTGEIIERKVVEIPFSYFYKRQKTSTFIGKYCPIITVKFKLNRAISVVDINLYNTGYESPEDAINAIAKVAPNKKVKFIQTFNNFIPSKYKEIMSNLRINEQSRSIDTISVLVNPKDINENEFLYKFFSYSKWIGPAIGLFFVAVLFLVPLFLFTPLLFSTRIYYILVTIVFTICLYYYGAPHVTTFLDKHEIGRSGVIGKSLFEVQIDSNYNGSQIEPYLQKPDTDGN